jgi:hypothetical protein
MAIRLWRPDSRYSSIRVEGAFGKGVNLTPDIEHALMYVPQKQNSCILVCDVAMGKMHENLSRPVKGKRDTVPDHPSMRGILMPCMVQVD